MEIPADEVRQATEVIARDIQKRVRIPGFRPGKAPLNLIRDRFSDHIRDELLHKLIPDHFRDLVQRENLSPVAGPRIEDVQLTDNEPLRFKAVFEVMPQYELKEYKGLEMPYDEPAVSDEEVQQGLERMREQHATYDPVDPRPLADGDYAEIAYEATAVSGKGKAIKDEDALVDVGGADTLPELTENLRGAQPGDVRSFVVNFPADFHDRRVAGTAWQYQVKVHAVKRKQLAELNDDFARDTGEFQTLEEMRADLRERLLAQRRRRAEQAAMDKLLDALVAQYDFPVPEALIERQLDSRLERLLRGLAAQGVDVQKLPYDWRKWRAENREGARKDVVAGLLLERIADQEAIQAEQAEMDAEIEAIAEAQKKSDDVVRARMMRDEEAMANLRHRIRMGKVQEFLFRNATKVATGTAQNESSTSQAAEQV